MPTAAVHSDDLLVDESIEVVTAWLAAAARAETREDRRTQRRLAGLLDDPAGAEFAMRFVDRVVRPESHEVAAGQLSGLARGRRSPQFLGRIDRTLLAIGARTAPLLPQVVMPLATRRMRQLVGHLVVDAGREPMRAHLARRRAEGFALNVNLLGEAVLGADEAQRRFDELLEAIARPEVDYVSVKASALVAQLPPWDHDAAVERVIARLRPLLLAGARHGAFVNLDMEEYHDLDVTIDAFTRVLGEAELRAVEAGIVLQAYLPDSFAALRSLVDWADRRDGADIKIRLVKGANLAMERVEAELRGWEQAPYATKAEVDANYKRCLDWVARPERLHRVRIGVASHNLFDVAWAHLLVRERGVEERVGFEMLQGMADALARTVRDDEGGLLLYTPVVRPEDFDVAISYLFRRLEENASDANFIRHLFDLRPGSAAFVDEAAKFRRAVAERWGVGERPRRNAERAGSADGFANEPDTDPVLPERRAWAAELVARQPEPPRAPMTTSASEVDEIVAGAVMAAAGWGERSPEDRRRTLRAVAEELCRRRGDLVAAMVHEGNKTVGEADPEVSEAVDFARWYADRALDTIDRPMARFEPLGVVVVVPPWNFPVAIPAGGVLAALAAGNAVVLKPAPETPRCAELVAECCWAAGVPDDVLRFVRTPDDEVGRRLVSHPDVGGVILTGSAETAELFRSWQPDLPLFAETSGKNAMVITPNADLDLAVADLVTSAFGHAGQKCSAASLAICVGEVARSDRFRRQLVDATRTLAVGPATDLATSMGPLIAEPAGKLRRALTELDAGEEWWLEPRRLAVGSWTPGIRAGVRPGSWFQRTECFGPVLGIVEAEDLDEAIAIQSSTDYGLTGGVHSLDEDEIERWLDRVEVGNAYVNRPTTGAIVRRQPFGGWKRSSVGPGAKAGGPDYVAMLGRWRAVGVDEPGWLDAARRDDLAVWSGELAREHDPSGLRVEQNVLRYRPISGLLLRIGAGTPEREVERIRHAARTAGVRLTESRASHEAPADLARRLATIHVERVRALGEVEPELRDAAAATGRHLITGEVTADGRIELLHLVREQSISRTRHRYGNTFAER
ncbi:MAG: bifunctional proline dehydrogenase/L-glutamate gamma-semialdehyde dehydrogenase [Actinomycetota bacterium]